MLALTRDQLVIGRELAAWLAGRRRRVRVVGASMEPTLREGQFVLVADRLPNRGEAALAHHPDQPDLLVIKRVASVESDGGRVLLSDNPAAGTDSRTWGPVGPDRIVGTATIRLDQPMRPLAVESGGGH